MRTVVGSYYTSESTEETCNPNHPEEIFPFLKLPPELRNKIYRRCLGIRECHGILHRRRGERGLTHPTLSFEPQILNLCRQIRDEATSMLPQTLTVLLEIGMPKRLLKHKDERGNDTPARLILPIPLQQILPYTRILPLQRCWIGTKLLPEEVINRHGSSSVYRIQIHRFMDTIRRFPKLDGLHVRFLRFEVQAGDVDRFDRGPCRQQMLGCFEQLRGFNIMLFSDSEFGDNAAWAEGLERLMRRPKLEDEGMVNGGLMVCQCKEIMMTSLRGRD
ncbi:MAG: hypothetical protein Q9188_001854 [Gyalolechia gomerana]